MIKHATPFHRQGSVFLDTSCVSLCVSVCPEGGESITVVIGDHSGRARLPARGAHLTVLVGVLESLDEAEDLVNVPAHRQVVDAVLAQGAFLVDDICCAECDASVVAIFDQAAVVFGDLLSDVGNHGDAHGTETSSLSRLHSVLAVGEVRVDGASNDLRVDGLKFSALVVELADFSGAHEREVQRPEEQHDVLACTNEGEKVGFTHHDHLKSR